MNVKMITAIKDYFFEMCVTLVVSEIIVAKRFFSTNR